MRPTWTMMLLASCAIEGDLAPGSASTDGADPRVEALANCVAVLLMDQNGDAYAEWTLTWDHNGDIVEQHSRYVDGFEIVWRYHYGAPHQRTATIKDSDDDADDRTERWTWEDGLIVEYEDDIGSDGFVDRIKHTTYNADGLWDTLTWFLDTTPGADAEITFEWEADGGGWYGVGDGLSRGVPYSEAVTYDAQGNWVRFAYAKEDYRTDWDHSTPNAIGYSAREVEHEVTAGVTATTDVLERTMDELGRPTGYVRTIDVTLATLPAQRTVYTTAYAYTCVPNTNADQVDDEVALPPQWFCQQAPGTTGSLAILLVPAALACRRRQRR